MLNMKGEVVGVNTMIISTSGSSAGIGFAVPGDAVKESTESIIEVDKERSNRSKNRKGRGWLGIDVALGSLETALVNRVGSTKDEDIGAFVTFISPNSPLIQPPANIYVTTITNGNIQVGDRIINIGGNLIANGSELVKELKARVEGEQVALTVENMIGEKRIIYVTLGKMPL